MKKIFLILYAFVFSIIIGLNSAQALFIKYPLKDQDKLFPVASDDDSCGLASAANMLAAAGYASGDTQTIYDRMTDHYGKNNAQFQHDALTWYLNNFGEVGNLYTLVSYYFDDGHLNPNYFLQELKRCQYVGIAIKWDAVGEYHAGAHALTLWGDNDGSTEGYFSDSDQDDGGDYTYYKWIDLGGGDWGLDDYYSWTNVDIYYAATLCPIPEPNTLLLLCGGILGIWGYKFRNRICS